jgi:hypothetical protein
LAGIAHLGVGLVSKQIAPRLPLWVLVVCAYLIDILFIDFMFTGLEQLPQSGLVTTAPWSHSLFMAVIWSVIAALVAASISRNSRIGIITGLLVFSHWVVDFITQPMTFVFPDSSGPLLHPFGGSPEIGLGLMSTGIGVIVCEGGLLLLGIVIYLVTLKQLKKEENYPLRSGII